MLSVMRAGHWADPDMRSLIERAFFADRLAIGLGIAVCSAAAVALQAYLPIPKLALLGVLVGLLIAWEAYDYRCGLCRVALESRVLDVPRAAADALRKAFQQANTHAAVELLSKQGPAHFMTALSVKCAYCPKCRNVARFKVAGWPAFVLSGSALGALVREQPKAQAPDVATTKTTTAKPLATLLATLFLTALFAGFAVQVYADLEAIRSGAEISVEVWWPIAMLHRYAGFWPAVAAAPAGALFFLVTGTRQYLKERRRR
jgi:hypothetical protein